MSNPSHSRADAVSGRKTGQILSAMDGNMIPQKDNWRFFSGDRLAYLVIAVAVGVGITVFFALSRVTTLTPNLIFWPSAF